MARTKAGKPKKNKWVKRVPLETLLAGYHPDELWALLVAAGASPGARHRWVSVGNLVHRASLLNASGTKSARVEQLEGLLNRCLAEDPQLSQLEDFVPVDPRQDAWVRLDDQTVRLFPGSIERPVADIDRALLLSEAVDDILIDRLGFGVRHLLEVALRYTDIATRILSSSWSDHELPGHGPIVMSESELTAAKTLMDFGTPEEFEDAPEFSRALEWATCDSHDLPYDPGHPQSPFGRFLRVRIGGKGGPVRWLPPAFIPEILDYGVTILAGEAVSASPNADTNFEQLVAKQVRQALWRFSPVVLGPPDAPSGPTVSRGNVVQWVSMLGPGRALLVQVVADLQLRDLPFEGPPAAVLASRRSGKSLSVRVPMPGGVLTLDKDVEVVPLLVVASSGHLVAPQDPELPAMSLEDLRWAASTASADSDLFTFCRDMSRRGRPEFFAWETMNVWEAWRANGKALFSGGNAPSFIVMEPHQSNTEWAQTASRRELEKALLKLNLPPLRDFDVVEDDRSGPPSLFQWRGENQHDTGLEAADLGRVKGNLHPRPAATGWTVHTGVVPFAITAAEPHWAESEFAMLLNNLAGAFTFGLRAIADVWKATHEGSEVTGYVVNLNPAKEPLPDGRTLWVSESTIVSEPGGRLVHAEMLVACAHLASAANSDIERVQGQMSRGLKELLVLTGINEAAAEQFAIIWRDAPPTLAISLVTAPTVRNDLPHPIALDDALISEVDRLVAEEVNKRGTKPGIYRGEEAKRLDRDVLAPAALKVLKHRMALYNAETLVSFGMLELERCVAYRDRKLRDIEQAAKRLNVEWDPVARYNQLENEYLMLRRCSETIVEAALRFSPSGEYPIDDLAWGEIIAAAYAYLNATMRSESVHHQITPTALVINDSFEIAVARDAGGKATTGGPGSGRVYDFDMAAYGEARAAFHLTDEIPNHFEASASGTLVSSDVDSAMLQDFGARGSDILMTLLALARWPLNDDDADIVVVSRDALIRRILDVTVLGNEPDGKRRVEAVLSMLVSTSTDLAAADWKPWHSRTRKRRVLVQPIPSLRDEALIIAPHFCLATLSVYRKYLDQGQLPWSQPLPPSRVNKALERLRSSRNLTLEKQIAQILREDDWNVIENVKETKPQRLNLPSLATEIDCVAGRSDSRVIWLLEVKDPVDAFAIPEIRRGLDTFYVDDRKPSYFTQMRRKYEDLAPHPAAVASALGLPKRTDEDQYVIQALFVTRQPIPAAFTNPPFSFTTVKNLEQVLSLD